MAARHLRDGAVTLTPQERIEYLEEENRQLRDMLLPTLSFPTSWRLRPRELIVLRALYAGRGRIVPHERLLALGWPDEVPVKAYTVTVSNLRLRLLSRGVDIITAHGVGYGLTDIGVAILRKALIP
jgi:DNA-binding response OmpR family regulator